MGAPKLRLLAASVALVGGLALLPTAAAVAEPVHAAITATVAGPAGVAAQTQAEAVLDRTAQGVVHGPARPSGGEPAQPPVWLLALLGPILVAGGIAMGVTIRRLR